MAKAQQINVVCYHCGKTNNIVLTKEKLEEMLTQLKVAKLLGEVKLGKDRWAHKIGA